MTYNLSKTDTFLLTFQIQILASLGKCLEDGRMVDFL